MVTRTTLWYSMSSPVSGWLSLRGMGGEHLGRRRRLQLADLRLEAVDHLPVGGLGRSKLLSHLPHECHRVRSWARPENYTECKQHTPVGLCNSNKLESSSIQAEENSR